MYSREILTGLVPSLTVDNSGLALSLVVLCVAVFLRLCYRASAYPPGPSSLSLLYHGLQTSADKPWITFSELGKKYGALPGHSPFDCVQAHHFVRPHSEPFPRRRRGLSPECS